MIRRGRPAIACIHRDGEVEVDVKPTPVRLAIGSCFGSWHYSAIGSQRDLVTTLPSTLLILDLADFRTLTAHHPELARAIDAEGKRRMSENQRLRESQMQSGVSPS